MPSVSIVRRGRLLVIAAFLGLSLIGAQSALAYNQLKPPGNPNNIGDCHDAGGGPCEHWAKTASNLSINVDVHLTTALTTEELDLQQIALGAMAQYNGVAARNPHLQQTTSSTTEEMWVTTANLNDPEVYASTVNTYNATTGLITYAYMKFNTQIEWNINYDYTCRFVAGGNEVCKADAHKVVRHEFGHAEGLAHIATAVGVMIQADPGPNYHSLQPDDKNGIIHIYGAYP
jgi:hypothetical protein